VDLEPTMKVLQALQNEEARYVVVGAVALNLLGLARMTRDLDIFEDPTPDNIERLKRALSSVFSDPHIAEISASDLAGEYPAIAYVPPEGDFSIDILSRLGEAFAYADIEAQMVSFDGLSIRVATPAMLYRIKKDTVRLQDRADAERLRERFGLVG